MNEQERLNALTAPLLTWYDIHKRVLPWRGIRDPYRIWVSEIMLQQTRVQAVLEYYARFMAELPDVYALAAVGEERLFKLWEGLGYYSRARNLHRAAQVLVNDCGGEFPRTREELLRLPGVGDYTASAIASIAFGEPEPAVDGNLLRVAARVGGIAEDIMDSGLTLSYLLRLLRERKPASVRICCLLDKPERRECDITPDYCGFIIPNRFVVGYGLDYMGLYRNLPYVGVLKPEVYGA